MNIGTKVRISCIDVVPLTNGYIESLKNHSKLDDLKLREIFCGFWFSKGEEGEILDTFFHPEEGELFKVRIPMGEGWVREGSVVPSEVET
jgi:hypothetical protein